jgi:fluoride exporter
VVDGIAKTVFTLTFSLASLSFGAHLASIVVPHLPAPSRPTRSIRFGLTALAISTYAATFAAYFLLPANYRHKATAALLFSYPGTLTRYLLSLWLNPLMRTIPLGTFTANSLGTALLGMFRVLQSIPSPVSQNVCALLQGLGDGYCGCLTTVSTFAAEVDTLEEWKAWFYAAISWVTGQLLLLVIFGSSYWAGHVREQMTCSFAR